MNHASFHCNSSLTFCEISLLKGFLGLYLKTLRKDRQLNVGMFELVTDFVFLSILV